MLNNIYNQTVTILNKLKQSDSVTGLDVWHKTVLKDVAWYAKSEKTVKESTLAVLIGTYITVLIPFHNEYKPYTKWKESGEQEDSYTLSNGDYIVLGEVKETITAQNVVKTMAKYEPNVCQVKHFEEAHNRFGATVQLKIEGV